MSSICEINAPVNITNNTKICQSSCNYLPEYSNTKIMVQNYDFFINIDLDDGAKAKFNNEDYRAINVQIFKRSIHQYNGKYAPGEILILHENVSKPKNKLYVSIPITISSITTSGTSLLTNIINEVNNNAPRSKLSGVHSSGSETVSPTFIPNLKFNLKKFIAPSSFIFYKGIFPIDCIENPPYPLSNIIVYTPENHSITLGKEDYNILETLLSDPILYPISKKKVQLYINQKGAGNEEEDIYIDCQPVNASDETVYVPNESANLELEKIQEELKKIVDGPLGAGIVGIILLLGMWYIIDNFFGLFRNNNIQKYLPEHAYQALNKHNTT